MGRHEMLTGFGGYAVCRMISEKTGCCGNIVLERNRVLSEQRGGESAARMMLEDRWNASRDGESCIDRCFIDAWCGTYAESIRHLSMLETAPFAKAGARMAFEISACRFIIVVISGTCANTRQNRVFADTCMFRCKYAILKRFVVRYFLLWVTCKSCKRQVLIRLAVCLLPLLKSVCIPRRPPSPRSMPSPDRRRSWRCCGCGLRRAARTDARRCPRTAHSPSDSGA